MRRGTPAAEEFGELVHKLRTEKDMSMRQVAIKMGVPTSTVSQVEKAQRAVKAPKLASWANALGVKESYLRGQWNLFQKNNPDPPLVRNNRKSTESKTLEDAIRSLAAPERSQVMGYIDCLIQQRKK